jgi:hypothetical protein
MSGVDDTNFDHRKIERTIASTRYLISRELTPELVRLGLNPE